ncbi:hypothetical protein RV02_GL001345 [Enterococcus gilvus]|nr:hypothetical protein RV02_GL001345 [Enterococcus gilvus]
MDSFGITDFTKKIAWIAIKVTNFFAIFLMLDQIIGFLH